MLFSIQSAYAVKITWLTNSAINEDWSEPLNWDLGRIPISTDSVMTFYADHIALPNNYIAEINYMFLIGNLTIPANSELIFTDGQFDALGTLNNYGTIRVNNSPAEGIVCSTQAANQPFNNFGKIYIDSSASKGLVISSNQVITNAEGGLIEITNSGGTNLVLGFPFINGILINSGMLRMKDAGNGIGMQIDHDLSELNNLACGKVILFDQLTMSAGTFDNSGFFKQDFDGDNDMGVLAVTAVNNNGVLEDQYAAFQNADFDIQALWIKLYENKQFKTGEKVEIFTVGAPTGINTGDIFTDKLLTQNAGTYNLNTNIWIPNQTANGNTKFFIETSQQSNTCSDTVRFDLEFPILAVNYWIGGLGTWQTPTKWSLGTVPSANDIVAIYDAADHVTISNYTAEAKKIFLAGQITNKVTGILNVGGVAGEIGMEVDEGVIINNGEIYVYQSALGMDIDNGSLTNNNLIKCTNTFTCVEVASFSGGLASMTNTGTIENTSGKLIHSNETIVNNSGSLIGYNPLYESINSHEMHNSGMIVLEGIGMNTGFSGSINNMNSGVLTLKNLAIGGKLRGENEGVIFAELCDNGVQVDGTLTNKNGGQITAMNNATGLYIAEGLLTNNAGGTITLSNNTQYGLHIKSPAIFQSTDMVNEGLVSIQETTGVGIYNGSDIINQENGIIRVTESTSHGVHLFQTGAELENFDQGIIDIKNSDGHGIFNEGANIQNRDEAIIEIDSAGMSAIYFGAYFNGFGTLYGVMTNLAHFEIGPIVTESGIHLETGTSITNSECSGELISKSKIQLDGTLINYGIYRHLTSASSTIGTNLQNHGVVHDPLGILPMPNSWNQGFYLGQKPGTYDEGELINSIVLKDPAIVTGFEIGTAWYLNEQLDLPGGIYDPVQNSFTPYGLAIDSSTFYFKIYNTNCIPAGMGTFSLSLQNPVNKVCGKIIWVGGLGIFNNALNWDKYRLPGTCDSLMVEGLIDSVLINIASPIAVDHITNNGTIQLSPSSDLTIKDNSGNGLLNKGNIINKGSLTIQNIAMNGYIGTLSSLLKNEGNVLVKDISMQGLVLTNGTIHNKGGATFTIDNILLESIRLKTGALFQQEGILNLND